MSRTTTLFRRGHRIQGVRPLKTRLQVERLEDRTVPSITILETEPNNTMAAANAAPLGFDPGEDTHVIVKGDISPLGDRDWFKLQLNAGDVIGAGLNGYSGLDPAVRFVNAAGTLLMSNDNHGFFGVAMPSKSPVRFVPPSAADSIFQYVSNTPGTYFIEVAAASDASAGKYAMDLAVARPGLESQPLGTKQILFVDFDGATTGAFGGQKRLSPLASFLPRWGLTAADENAVIDAILGTMRENLSQDVRARGLNGDFARTGIPGQFDIEIRNSRDHVDDFGRNPFVSRVIIGGTRAELGDDTVGIAQFTDPGNFSTDDDAVVLLDRLSGPTSDLFSLNQFAIHPSHTKIELVGTVVGNIASHEAGHIFGNWHTDGPLPPDVFVGVYNLMDGRGANTRRPLGPDLVFGTHDDIDMDFGVDIYSTVEVFVGVEDTLNVISFGLATGKGIAGGGGSGGGGSGSGSGSLDGFGRDARAEIATLSTPGRADPLGQGIDPVVVRLLQPAPDLLIQTEHLPTSLSTSP